TKEVLKNVNVQVEIKCDYKEIILQMNEYILSEWQKEYERNETGQFYKVIEENVSNQIKYKRRNRKQETTMTRLRLGRCKLNYDMFRMGLHATGQCETCLQPEPIEYYLMNCKHSNIGYIVKNVNHSNGIYYEESSS